MTISKWYEVLAVRVDEDFATGSFLADYRDSPQERLFFLTNDLDLETISVAAEWSQIERQIWDGLHAVIFLGLTKDSTNLLAEVWERTDLPIFVIVEKEEEAFLLQPNQRVTVLHWIQSDWKPVLAQIRNYLTSQNRTQLPDFALITGENKLIQIFDYQFGLTPPIEAMAERARPLFKDLTGRQIKWRQAIFEIVGDVEGQWQLDPIRALILKPLSWDNNSSDADKIVLLPAVTSSKKPVRVS